MILTDKHIEEKTTAVALCDMSGAFLAIMPGFSA